MEATANYNEPYYFKNEERVEELKVFYGNLILLLCNSVLDFYQSHPQFHWFGFQL
jgi:hypothetical protein